MRRVYVCTKIDGLESLLQVALDGVEDIEVFVESEVASLISNMSFMGMPDLIILDDQQLGFLNENDIIDIKNKVLFTEHDKDGWNCYKQDEWQDAVTDYLGDELGDVSESSYAKVPLKIVRDIGSPFCDIFLQIKKDGSPHYVKRFNKNEPVDDQAVQKYLDKGITSAFIKSDDKQQFLNLISNNLYTNLADNPKSENVVGRALDTAVELLNDIGYTAASTQLIEGVVDSINDSLGKTKNDDILLLKKLLGAQTSIFYKKSHLISMFGIRMLEATDWASSQHQEMFTYLALLCDVTLNQEKMLFITSNAELDQSGFSDDEKQIVWQHARDSFQSIQSFKERPLETDLLILEHHGNKNGLGFTDNLSSQLHNITLYFRICEDFTLELLKKQEAKEQIKIADIFADLTQKHDKKSLHVIIDLLKSCFVG